LGLDLIPAAVMQREADWYRQKMTPLGVPLDVRNANTKTDWELWAAAAIDDPVVRAAFVDGVYDFVTTSGSRVPFTDLYDTSTGLQPGLRFQARPVIGGVFSILVREQKSL
jgi:Glutaminase A six helical-hairpin domain